LNKFHRRTPFVQKSGGFRGVINRAKGQGVGQFFVVMSKAFPLYLLCTSLTTLMVVFEERSRRG